MGRLMKTRKTILVVEADESLRACLFEILDKEGHHAVSVQNVAEGLLFLEAKDLPSLIIFDLAEPDRSDWAFTLVSHPQDAVEVDIALFIES